MTLIRSWCNRSKVPLKIHLDRLHLVLQVAKGSRNSHLYEIPAHDVGAGACLIRRIVWITQPLEWEISASSVNAQVHLSRSLLN